MGKKYFRFSCNYLVKITPLDISMYLFLGVRDAIYKAVMTNGTRQTFNQMKNLYRNAELAEEKNRILHALGYSQEPNVVAQILEFSLSVEVPPQDSIVTLSSVASNRYSYKQAWTFFANNIEKITKRYILFFFKCDEYR